MEALGQFGINPILLAAQIVNFLIILYIVRKFALKPIQQILKNRQNTIKEGLQQAEEARLLLEQTAEKESKVLRKAQQDAKLMLDEAKKLRDETIAHAEAKTREQTEKMLKEAREQITFETREAEKRLSAHVSELAVSYLEKALKGTFKGPEQSQIFDQALQQIKKKAD